MITDNCTYIYCFQFARSSAQCVVTTIPLEPATALTGPAITAITGIIINIQNYAFLQLHTINTRLNIFYVSKQFVALIDPEQAEVVL